MGIVDSVWITNLKSQTLPLILIVSGSSDNRLRKFTVKRTPSSLRNAPGVIGSCFEMFAPGMQESLSENARGEPTYSIRWDVTYIAMYPICIAYNSLHILGQHTQSPKCRDKKVILHWKQGVCVPYPLPLPFPSKPNGARTGYKFIAEAGFATRFKSVYTAPNYHWIKTSQWHRYTSLVQSKLQAWIPSASHRRWFQLLGKQQFKETLDSGDGACWRAGQCLSSKQCCQPPYHHRAPL